MKTYCVSCGKKTKSKKKQCEHCGGYAGPFIVSYPAPQAPSSDPDHDGDNDSGDTDNDATPAAAPATASYGSRYCMTCGSKQPRANKYDRMCAFCGQKVNMGLTTPQNTPSTTPRTSILDNVVPSSVNPSTTPNTSVPSQDGGSNY